MSMSRFAMAFVSCMLLAGCVGKGAVNPMDGEGSPRAVRSGPPAPNLRIPANAVASAQDIPLVPVPPIPLGKGTPPPADAPRPNLSPAPAPVLPPVPAPGVAVTPVSGAEPAGPATGAQVETTTPSLRQLQEQAAAWYSGVDSYI